MRLYSSSRRASQRFNSIRFPAKAAVRLLTLALFVFLLICIFPTIATAASPHIYDVPQSGPPESQTTVLGNGWDPNATLDIYFDSTDVGLVDTDNHGSFGMALKAPTIRQNGFAIQIPKDAVQGTHWITAVERITQLQAQVPFTVWINWPQFHYGPDRTGFNPYEYILSPDTVPNLQVTWKFAGPMNSPTVANGVVYVSVAGDYTYALDASTGAIIWKGIAGNELPAVANGVVYICAWTHQPYALNASTGAVIWNPGRDVYCNAPLVVTNGVVYASGGNLLALDAATGALIWEHEGGYTSRAAVANGVVYFVGIESKRGLRSECSHWSTHMGSGDSRWVYFASGGRWRSLRSFV